MNKSRKEFTLEAQELQHIEEATAGLEIQKGDTHYEKNNDR